MLGTSTKKVKERSSYALFFAFFSMIRRFSVEKLESVFQTLKTLFIRKHYQSVGFNLNNKKKRRLFEEYISRKQLFYKFLHGRPHRLALWLLLLLISGREAFAQPSYNASLACQTANATAAVVTKGSITYAGLAKRTVSGGANSVLTEAWKVTTDANGQVGFAHSFTVNYSLLFGGACLDQTSNARQFALYNYSGGACSGTAIAPTITNDAQAIGGTAETNRLNPAWTGLTPNTDYVVIVKITVGSSCTGISQTAAGYYGSVQPQSPCNCASGTSCDKNVYTSITAAHSAWDLVTYTQQDLETYNLDVSGTPKAYEFCTNYTTGANETRVAVRHVATSIQPCILAATITYNICTLSGNTPTFLGANLDGGTRNFQYYSVQPSTTYRFCRNLAFPGGTNCNTPSVGETDTEVESQGWLIANATPPPASFTFNCGTASVAGTFAANGTGGQTGTLTVPITGATAGSAVFNVSGTGFTGTLSTNLTAGQTSVVIPITYDGSGSFGSRTLSVTASVGTASGSCSKAVFVNGTPTATPGCINIANYNCSGVVNGTFANGLAGWTSSGGWYDGGGFAYNITDNVTTAQVLKQTLSGLTNTQTAGQVILKFDAYAYNVLNTSNVEIYLGGTKYATLTNNVTARTITASGGASVNTTTMANATWVTGITLTIPWTGPDTGDLEFRFTSGLNDFGIDNVSFNAVCSGGLTAWFKADDLSGADGSAVTSWANGALNGYDVTQGNATNQPKLYNSTSAKLINFNPALEFDGTNDYLRNLNPLMSNTTPYTFLGVNTDEAADLGYRAFFSSQQYVDHFILYKQNGATADNGWTPYAIGGLLSDRGTFGKGTKFSIDGGSNGYWNGTNFTSDASTDIVQPSIVGMSGNNVLGTASRTDFFTWADGYKGNPGNWSPTDEGNATYQSYLFKAFAIGADMSAADAAFEFWKGRIPEIVAYNRQLTDTEMQKVNSYFAIKYGVTLGQGNGFVSKNGNNYNYVRGDGTTIWDATANTSYKNDIFGIGRDNCQGLYQKQSKSVNSTSFVTVSNGSSVAATNAANTSTLTDTNFEVIGDNGLSLDYANVYVPTSFSPAGGFYRMNRIWKVQETGTVGSVTVSVPAGADRLLVSSSASFGAGTQEIALVSDGNGNVTATIDFTNGQYFSFGRDIVAPGCVASGLQVWLKADAGTSTTTDASPLTQWDDQSGNSRNHTQSNASYQPKFKVDGGFNYNPAVTFDGSDALVTNAFASGKEAVHVFAMAKVADNGWRALYGFGRDATHVQWLSTKPSVWIPGNYDPATALGLDYGITSFLLPKDATQRSINWNGVAGNIATTNNYTFNANKMAVGSDIDNAGTGLSENFFGDIQEIIVYKTGTPTLEGGAMPATDIQKIQSYLGIKYGITLPHNYLSGDGTTVYAANGGTATDYDSNVFGIGRDDCQELNQKQSTSTSDNYAKVSLGTLATTNVANTGAFTANKSFEMIGDNGLAKDFAIAYTPTTFTPAGTFLRMSRIWKVDETGTVGTVRITVPAGADRLLVSNTDAFGAGTQELALTSDGNGGLYAV